MKIYLPLIPIALLALASCRSKQVAVPSEKEVVRIETVTEVKWDTVYFQIPYQSAEATGRDSVSHLETEYAMSDARILPDGTLYHFLQNKAIEHKEIIPTTITHTDSIVVRWKQVPVHIEKQLGKWKQFQLDAFWWLALALLAIIAAKFRKPLLGMVKHLSK